MGEVTHKIKGVKDPKGVMGHGPVVKGKGPGPKIIEASLAQEDGRPWFREQAKKVKNKVKKTKDKAVAKVREVTHKIKGVKDPKGVMGHGPVVKGKGPGPKIIE